MDLLEKATCLHVQGFSTIPTNEVKAPMAKNWQQMKDADRVKPNGNFKEPRTHGIGIVTGSKVGDNYLLAIDVDCYVKDVSHRMLDAIAKVTGRELNNLPYRVGQSPKFLVPVLCPENTVKKVSQSYHTGECDTRGIIIASRVEVLGDGQQFVAYGSHSPGKQYKWHHGDLDVESLPVLTMDQIDRIVVGFEKVANHSGMQIKEKQVDFDDDDDNFLKDVYRDPVDMSLVEVEDTLTRYPAQRLEYDDWMTVGMAIHHQTRGRGYELWRDWSAESDKHDEAQMLMKWRSFERHEGAVKTFLTVIKLANKYSKSEEAIEEAFATAPVVNNLFRQMTDDIWSEQKRQDWLIQGVVERGSMGVLYGPPKTGKSFLALDMALHLAHGIDWCGHRVPEGGVPVFYVAGEGRTGVERRIAGWRLEHGITGPSRLWVSAGNIVINDESFGSVVKFIETLPEDDRPQLLIGDTWSRMLGGEVDENSNTETASAVKRLDHVKEKLNLTIMLIHHTPKGDSTTMRGASSLQGAVDFSMSVSQANDSVVLTSRDQKDGTGFSEKAFQLISYTLPEEMYLDNFGDASITAVARLSDEDTAQAHRKLNGNAERLEQLLRVVEDAIPQVDWITTSPGMFDDDHFKGAGAGVPLSALKDKFYAETFEDDDGKDSNKRRSLWNNSKKALIKSGRIRVGDSHQSDGDYNPSGKVVVRCV